jgi:hypothetical protein
MNQAARLLGPPRLLDDNLDIESDFQDEVVE